MSVKQPSANLSEAAASTVFAVPKDTTPTWEMELLLSGALVFSMLQAPGLLDDALFAARPRISGGLQSGVILLYFYLKIVSYALIGTFILHLASRAIWVAALGLRSVYPDGVLWEKLSRGPIYLEFAKRTTPTLDRMIDQADNRASLVFAFGLLLVLMSLAIMMFTMCVVVPGAFLEQWLRGSHGNTTTTLLLVGIIVIPATLAPLIDRRYGARLAPGHPLRRAIEAVYRSSSWLTWSRITGPILLTFFSRMGMVRGNVVLIGLMYSLMGLILLEVLIRTGGLALPGEQYLPQNGHSRELRSVHYANTRDQREALQGQPYIASEVIRGPYLKLFVAYVPRRLDDVIARDCPAAMPAPEPESPSERAVAEETRTQALLECVAQTVHPVLLDGNRIPDLRYDIARDPDSGLRGFVSMLDVRTLGAGRHELSIQQPLRPGEQPTDRPPWVIPFWR
jgi:hypothetical protein